MSLATKLKFVTLASMLGVALCLLVQPTIQARPVIPNCGVCLCRNVQAYQTYSTDGTGASSISGYWVVRDNGDGTSTRTTQAFASCQTNATCSTTDTKGQKLAGQQVAVFQAAPSPVVSCNANFPPPGQSIYVEATGTAPALPKDTPSADRYLCGPP